MASIFCSWERYLIGNLSYLRNGLSYRDRTWIFGTSLQPQYRPPTGASLSTKPILFKCSSITTANKPSCMSTRLSVSLDKKQKQKTGGLKVISLSLPTLKVTFCCNNQPVSSIKLAFGHIREVRYSNVLSNERTLKLLQQLNRTFC